jgi:DNA-binding transcriptional regulator GbsR (MarR family)
MSSLKIDVPKEVSHLADLVGQFIQYWGFKKIHGEIWAHIWLAQNPIDATTLVKRLGVSKALVSLAIKDLLQYDVIRTSAEDDRRKILLLPNKDVQTVITNVLKKRESILLQKILEAQESLEHASPECLVKIDISLQQLEHMKLMTTMAQMALSGLIASNLDLDK